MNTKQILVSVVAMIAIIITQVETSAAPQARVNLGTAENFAVLAAQSISSTSGGTINGNVGESPGSTFTPGTPAVTINGVLHLADGVALQAQTNLTAAYIDAAGRTVPSLISTDLGGMTLAPGLYKDNAAPASLGLTGTLILDAQGDPNAVWIFQSASTLDAAVNSTVILTNGAQACNVFWQVGSSATILAGATFKGNIMAYTSITLGTLATLEGRALALNASITLDNNTITLPCGSPYLIGMPADTSVSCDAVPLPSAVLTVNGCSSQTNPAVMKETILPGPCPSTYTLLRIWTAGNLCGDSISATQSIAVADTTPPEITCPTSPIMVPGDSECQATVPDLTRLIPVFDSCSGTNGLVVTQNPPGGTLFNLQTNVTLTASDACGNTNICTVLLTTPCAPLIAGYRVDKTLSSPTNRPALAGEPVVFLISVVNTGEVALLIVPVEDQYSTNFLSFASATMAPVNTNNDGILNWANVGPLATGATVNLSVTFTATGGTAGNLATNVVIVSPVTPGISLPVETNSATYRTTTPGYTLSKTVLAPLGGSAQLGQTIVFQVTVVNTGEVILATLPLEDQYSTNFLSFVSATLAPVNTNNDGILNWTNMVNLLPGASNSLFVTFLARSLTPAGQSVTNMIIATPTNMPSLTNRAPYRVNTTATPVTLKSFSAAYDGPAVLVTWETGVELDNLGFNVERADNPDGARIKLNSALIPGMGNSQGRRYEWRDTVPDPTATYYYWMEDISWKLVTQTHGPVMAMAPGAVDKSASLYSTIGSFSLATNGLYRVGWVAMKAAGLPVESMNPDHVQIYVQGQQVATFVSSAGTVLSEGDSVVFYSPAAAESCAIGMGTNALRMELVYARPSRTSGDVWAESAGPDQQALFIVSTNYVRYMLADFVKTPVWVLDIADPVQAKLMYGFSYVRGNNGLSAVYMSYPGAAAGPVRCTAIGEQAVMDVPVIHKTP